MIKKQQSYWQYNTNSLRYKYVKQITKNKVNNITLVMYKEYFKTNELEYY